MRDLTLTHKKDQTSRAFKEQYHSIHLVSANQYISKSPAIRSFLVCSRKISNISTQIIEEFRSYQNNQSYY